MIGVIGLNGSGKSSLLRIMAGVDKEFNGQTILNPGHTIGFLGQNKWGRSLFLCCKCDTIKL